MALLVHERRDADAKTGRFRAFGVFGGVAVANVVLWIGFLALTTRYPFLLSLGVLAWVFGLRHAVDADHLAAIDNTTRKFMQDGRRPLTVGLFFSLGHSTIVFVLSLAIALGAEAMRAGLPGLEKVGAIVGTMISAAFLLLIAALNIVILRDLYRVFREMAKRLRTGVRQMPDLELTLSQQGLMNRVLGRFYRAIHSEWQMYPVGLLFGLGFDTASEVALLAMSAVAIGRGMPVALVLSLPLLFAAGMSLVDTLDGVLMQYAYGWAFENPIRKVYYNLTITGVSVAIALGIGGMETLQVIGDAFSLHGAFWRFLHNLSFSTLGYFIAAMLLLGWLLSLSLYKRRGWDRLGMREER